MVDYRRMERQYYANKVVVLVLITLILLDVDEIYYALKYHFPWWDDVMMFVSAPLTYLSWFVKKYTDMYRIDL
jgi:nicotinamide riboside transporter PnuC